MIKLIPTGAENAILLKDLAAMTGKSPIGNEYKAERKILLKNLSGNSSWKNGAPEKEVAACE